MGSKGVKSLNSIHTLFLLRHSQWHPFSLLISHQDKKILSSTSSDWSLNFLPGDISVVSVTWLLQLQHLNSSFCFIVPLMHLTLVKLKVWNYCLHLLCKLHKETFFVTFIYLLSSLMIVIFISLTFFPSSLNSSTLFQASSFPCKLSSDLLSNAKSWS